jgi:uncharacterized membrane protein
MKSRASIAAHPIHPMLVVFPIALWVFSFIADLINAFGGDETWMAVSYYAMAGGIIGALAAAIPGVIELFSITHGQTRRIGIVHMTLNLVIVALYVINLVLRSPSLEPTAGLIWLSGLSIALLVVSGWYGGEMVYRRGVGVEGYDEHLAPTHR